MKLTLKSILSSLLIIANAGYAMEQNDSSTMLPDVEITGIQKVDIGLTPLTVSIIDSKEIRESQESNILPVLSLRVPGLFVTERGAGGYGVSDGAAGAVNIRGIGQGNKVLFLIDGEPQWAGLFGHSLPDTYASVDLEKVEIVRGPSSILYGSGAMGGSINLITRKARKEGFGGKASMAWGNFHSQNYNAHLAWKKERLNIFASGMYESTKGNRPGMKYWLGNQYFGAGYSFSDHWKARLAGTWTESYASNPGPVSAPLEDMWTHIFRQTLSASLSNDYGKFRGGARIYHNYGRHRIDDGFTPGGQPRDNWFRSTDYNMGLTIYQSMDLWKGNTLSAGIDVKRWGGHYWNEVKADRSIREGDKRHVTESAIYAMMQQEFFNRFLSINAGVRVEHNSAYGTEGIPHAGFIIRPDGITSVKFDFSKGFRSPNIRELYLYRPANPDLDPERLLSYEISASRSFLSGRLNAGISLYFIDADNMIQMIVADSRPLNVNTGKLINKGFEADIAFQALSWLNLSAIYSYLHTSSATLTGVPKNTLNLIASARYKGFSASLENRNVWSLRTGTAPGDKESFSLLDLRLSYDLPARIPVTLNCKIKNITDTRYEVVAGYPMPGINFMAGFDVKF